LDSARVVSVARIPGCRDLSPNDVTARSTVGYLRECPFLNGDLVAYSWLVRSVSHASKAMDLLRQHRDGEQWQTLIRRLWRRPGIRPNAFGGWDFWARRPSSMTLRHGSIRAIFRTHRKQPFEISGEHQVPRLPEGDRVRG
jgi:hypothetical protein